MNALVQAKYRLGIVLVDLERAIEGLHLAGPDAASLSDEAWIECVGAISDARSRIFQSLDTLKHPERAVPAS